MTLGDSVLDYINRGPVYPPFALTRALYTLCEELTEPDEIPLRLALGAWFSQGVLPKLHDAFKATQDEYLAEFKKWDADRDGYRKQPSVPLYELLPIGECIQSIHGHFLYDIHELAPKKLLASLRQQLRKNEAGAHGLSVYQRSKTKVPSPSEMDEEPYELVEKYLHHTPFYPFFCTQVPFRIPRKIFASHGIILAPPNHGKTQLLGSLLSSFLSDDASPVGCFVLDPHGDLFSTLKHRVRHDRLVLLDPDVSPPPLNFLDFGTSTEAQTLQTFSYLMSSLSGGLSDKQGAIVPYLLKLLRVLPHASLETLREIVDEKPKRVENSKFYPAISTLPQVDQGFFHNQFYNSRMQETKDAIGWKLYSALSSDAFRQMFSAKTNSFDADAAMRDRKVVLVKGARRSLGDDGMSIFLQFIIAQFFAAALRREAIQPERRHLCLLFVDEAHHCVNSQTANILTECRKYGLGWIGATQVLAQIPEDVKAALYGATAIKIAGPVAHTDAMILARETYCTADFIRSMDSVEGSHAHWAIHVSPNKKAFKVRVPYGALEALPILRAGSHERASTHAYTKSQTQGLAQSTSHQHSDALLSPTPSAPKASGSDSVRSTSSLVSELDPSQAVYSGTELRIPSSQLDYHSVRRLYDWARARLGMAPKTPDTRPDEPRAYGVLHQDTGTHSRNHPAYSPAAHVLTEHSEPDPHSSPDNDPQNQAHPSIAYPTSITRDLHLPTDLPQSTDDWEPMKKA